jgi:hypothetical protein
MMLTFALLALVVSCANVSSFREKEMVFFTGNEIPRIVAHRCIMEASIDVLLRQKTHKT